MWKKKEEKTEIIPPKKVWTDNELNEFDAELETYRIFNEEYQRTYLTCGGLMIYARGKDLVIVYDELTETMKTMMDLPRWAIRRAMIKEWQEYKDKFNALEDLKNRREYAQKKADEYYQKTLEQQ